MDWLTLVSLAAALTSLLPSYEAAFRDPKCPVRLLKGGRVRIRSRGRVAKYICLRGYQVLGDKYSTCVRGKWDTPLPVCINGGCISIDVPHGQVLETYRGAFMTVHCDPGYTLVGTQSLYCNGAVWNDTAPICRDINVAERRQCDFENEDLCGWTHDANHDFDWRRHSFATPSGHFGTGPSFDHTLGPGLNGHYMYLETSSPRLENDTARLFSPVFSPPNDSTSCFVFWYHMFGINTGSLNIYIHNQDSQTTLLFSITGDQGNAWEKALVPLPPINSNFQMLIEGVRGPGYIGDTAIDDVNLAEGEDCIPDSTTTMETNTDGTMEGSCDKRCFGVSTDPSLCDCTSDCIRHNTCCTDYELRCLAVSTDEDLPLTTIKTEDSSSNHTLSVPKPTSTDISRTTLTSILNTVNNTTIIPSIFTTNPGVPVLNSNATYGKKMEIGEETSIKPLKQLITTKALLSHLRTTPTISIFNSSKSTDITMKIFITKGVDNISNIIQSSTAMIPSSPKTTIPFMIKVVTTPIDLFPNFEPITHTSRLPTTKKVQNFVTKPIILRNKTLWLTKPTSISFEKTHVTLPKIPGTSQYIPKLEFLTPPPIVFRTPIKTTSYQPFTANKVTMHKTVPTIFNSKGLKNSTKDVIISKNDVLHSSWDKNASQFSYIHNPTTLTKTLTTKSKFISHVTSITKRRNIVVPTIPTSEKNQWSKYKHSITTRRNIVVPSIPASEKNQWSKYKHSDQMPVHAQYAKSSSSSEMIHVIVLVGVLLLILTTVLVTTCVIRRRKINRRSFEDDELDIRFLASDEILDFTLARPNEYNVCETVR